jgi:hypothetical protein
VADLIAQEFDVSYHAGHVWKILRQLSWSVQRPGWPGARTRRSLVSRRWKSRRWPEIKKKSASGGHTIVFIAESGLSQELNPVEYLWGHWKRYELPNVCPGDLWQLSEGARRTLRRLRRRPTLITAFWKLASLFK